MTALTQCWRSNRPMPPRYLRTMQRLTQGMTIDPRRTRSGRALGRFTARADCVSWVFALFLSLPSDARASFLSPELRTSWHLHRAVRAVRRPGRAHRPLLDGARPAGEDRPQAPPSPVRSDPHAVPAVAGVRRAALADCVDLGVLEAGPLQDGVRHRQAVDDEDEHEPGAGKPCEAQPSRPAGPARGARYSAVRTRQPCAPISRRSKPSSPANEAR